MRRYSKGFTLVELAIVMTIIGLLIGGILKGQELLENARITSTIAQVKSFDAAITAFRDIYDGWPGDLPAAGSRIPGCDANCTPDTYGAGDGVVGDAEWQANGWGGGMMHPPSAIVDEHVLFWLHLLKANLTTGTNDTAMRIADYPYEWGVTHPAGKAGGGFIAGYVVSDDHRILGNPDAVLKNGKFALFLFPALANWGSVSGDFVLTPLRASQIDLKMDDGVPNTGDIMPYGVASSCYANNGGGYSYNGSVAARDCSLLFFMQH